MSLLDERELPAATEVAPTLPSSSRPVTDARTVWRRFRVPVAIAVVIIVIFTLIALAQGSNSASDLSPTSYTPGGSRAVATLLGERGDRVTQVDTVPDPAAAAATTVLVPESLLLNDDSLQTLLQEAHSTDVVIVLDDDGSAESLGVGIDDTLDSDRQDPGCAFGPASVAGAAQVGTASFGPGDPAGFHLDALCYRGTLAEFRPTDGGTGSLVLTTGPAFLQNQNLDRGGDAALALGLLDHGKPVSWVQPAQAQPISAGDDRSTPLLQLLPHRLKVAIWELAVAALLLALWRLRRTGPVVVERLPVVVRAVETVRGRARLYRSADARDRAVLALREAARAKLATRLGLGASTLPPALVDAVVARTGRSREHVAGLLYGAGAPPDDPSLVHFADELDALCREAGQR